MAASPSCMEEEGCRERRAPQRLHFATGARPKTCPFTQGIFKTKKLTLTIHSKNKNTEKSYPYQPSRQFIPTPRCGCCFYSCCCKRWPPSTTAVGKVQSTAQALTSLSTTFLGTRCVVTERQMEEAGCSCTRRAIHPRTVEATTTRTLPRLIRATFLTRDSGGGLQSTRHGHFLISVFRVPCAHARGRSADLTLTSHSTARDGIPCSRM